MDPRELAGAVTNRRGRAERERERNAADNTAQKSQAMAETIIRDIPGMRADIAQLKNKLGNLETR